MRTIWRKLENLYQERKRLSTESRTYIEGRMKGLLLALLREGKPMLYFSSLPQGERDEDGTIYIKEYGIVDPEELDEYGIPYVTNGIVSGYRRGLDPFSITEFAQMLIDSQQVQNLTLSQVMYLVRKTILSLQGNGIQVIFKERRNSISGIFLLEKGAISTSATSKNRPIRKKDWEFNMGSVYEWNMPKKAWIPFLSPHVFTFLNLH